MVPHEQGHCVRRATPAAQTTNNTSPGEGLVKGRNKLIRLNREGVGEQEESEVFVCGCSEEFAPLPGTDVQLGKVRRRQSKRRQVDAGKQTAGEGERGAMFRFTPSAYDSSPCGAQKDSGRQRFRYHRRNLFVILGKQVGGEGYYQVGRLPLERIPQGLARLIHSLSEVRVLREACCPDEPLRGGRPRYHVNDIGPISFEGLRVSVIYGPPFRNTMPGFAHFDADEPLRDALCISSFLVSMTDEGLLLGRMRDHKEWNSLDRIAAGGPGFEEGRWVLPASHLRVGEDPAAAAERIASEQLRARYGDLSLWRVLSFAYPFPSRNQDLHWDVCFIYGVEAEVLSVPPWFAEIRRVPPGEIERLRFARGHGDVIEELGLTS